jgi:hypothetical protein
MLWIKLRENTIIRLFRFLGSSGLRKLSLFRPLDHMLAQITQVESTPIYLLYKCHFSGSSFILDPRGTHSLMINLAYHFGLVQAIDD